MHKSNSDKFDAKLNKLFYQTLIDKQITFVDAKKNEPMIVIPSKEHKEWLVDFLADTKIWEEYQQNRMICYSCKEKIIDDKYIVVVDPNYPDNLIKTRFYHSKGKCDPRKKETPKIREEWLNNHLNG